MRPVYRGALNPLAAQNSLFLFLVSICETSDKSFNIEYISSQASTLI